MNDKQVNDTVTHWIEKVWSVLDSIPGASETVARERSAWQEFRDLETVEVVVFGAYDAGKSSLLKRLLVEWEVPVPEWLTVSGRRETFESKRVEARGFGLVDTPGLGGGNSEHDELTLIKMRLADAYLWVLPPQLITTGKERFLEILFGDAGIADSTIAIVARMDEAGIDPSDDVTAFSQLCKRKKDELSEVVEEASSDRSLRSIHCVVADPYQMVGNSPNPEPEIYEIGRSWDGVEDLAREILDLRERRRALRVAAGARFVRLLLGDVHEELQRLMDDLALSKKGLENEIDRHAVHQQRLDALQSQARAELRRRIEEALLSVSRSGEAGVDSFRNLEETLAEAVDEWAEESFADYRQLAGELELEVRERNAGPSMAGFRRLTQEAEKHEANENAPGFNLPKNGRRVLLGLGPALHKAFETYAGEALGMSLKEAAKRLRKLESSKKTVEEFIKSQGRRATFQSAKHAKEASSLLKKANLLAAVGPLVEQLGSVLLEIGEDVMTAKRAKERAHRRLELRRQLRDEAEKLEESVAADFNSTCGGLRVWLSERRSTLQKGHDTLSKQFDSLAATAESLDQLIQAYPL